MSRYFEKMVHPRFAGRAGTSGRSAALGRRAQALETTRVNSDSKGSIGIEISPDHLVLRRDRRQCRDDYECMRGQYYGKTKGTVADGTSLDGTYTHRSAVAGAATVSSTRSYTFTKGGDVTFATSDRMSSDVVDAHGDTVGIWAAYDRGVVAELDAISVVVVSIGDLITMKRSAGRAKDLEDIAALEAIVAEGAHDG